jgi:hypothetical protein
MSDEEYEKLIAMIRIQCTRDEICGIFGMSDTTLNRRLAERGDENFEALYKRHCDEGKASLRRQQWAAAQKGNPTMLIWLGKQMLGQTDKVDTRLTGQMSHNLSEQTIEQINYRIEQLSGIDGVAGGKGTPGSEG